MDLAIKYDPDVDVLVLKIREGVLANEELLDNDIILGYDKDGKLLYVEVMDASKKGLINTLLDLAKNRKEAAKLILSKVT
ncbi:MAG: DUF2283 domain-containing protein [Candidatus Bathyarchaeia archaeon]